MPFQSIHGLFHSLIRFKDFNHLLQLLSCFNPDFAIGMQNTPQQPTQQIAKQFAGEG
jgi:hypothetical protein